MKTASCCRSGGLRSVAYHPAGSVGGRGIDMTLPRRDQFYRDGPGSHRQMSPVDANGET